MRMLQRALTPRPTIFRVHQMHSSGKDAGVYQRLDLAPAGGAGCPHALRQIGVAQRGVLLQGRNDPAINCVDLPIPFMRRR